MYVLYVIRTAARVSFSCCVDILVFLEIPFTILDVAYSVS